MIGLTQYSPAVISLLINRENFLPLAVNNILDETLTKISNFIAKPDPRIKVLIVSGLTVFEDLEDIDLTQIKIILFDSIANLVKIELEFKDFTRETKPNDSSIQFFSLTPSELNNWLEKSSFGGARLSGTVLTEDVELRAKVIQRNLDRRQVKGTLGTLIVNLTAHLGNREKASVAESIAKFIAGIIGKHALNKLAKEYLLNIEDLIAFVNSKEGYALRVAFMETNIYHVDLNTVIDNTKANRLDLEYLVSLLPLNTTYEYAFKIPNFLVERNEVKEKKESES